MEGVKLKPCPFCGGKAVIYEMKCGWYVDCDNDEKCSHNPCQQNGIHRKEDAINAWNTPFIDNKEGVDSNGKQNN